MALTSTQVHNVTVAMFGAAAGGYTEELQAFESQSALVDFLATLDLFDTTFPQTTNIGFANALVEQMAASATDAGKEEAVDLIMGALAEGMSKAWVINWAIDGLLATTSAEFADAKADFMASVEGAVAFSAENADVIDPAALQAGVAATVADLALTAALNALAAANEAVDANLVEQADYLEAAFTNKTVKAVVTDQTGSASTKIEADDVVKADLAGAHNDAADALNAKGSLGTADLYGTDSATTNDTKYAKVDNAGNEEGMGDEFNALTDSVQDARIAAAEAVLQADIDAAQKTVDTAAKDLKTNVASLVAAANESSDALVAALDAEDAQDAATANALAAAAAVTTDASTGSSAKAFATTSTAGVISYDADGSGAIPAINITEVSTDGVVSFKSSVVTLDATTGIYTIENGTNDATLAKSYLDAVLAAAQADVDADKAVTTAQNALADSINAVLEAQDSTFDGDANNYANLIADSAVTPTLTVGSVAIAIDYSVASVSGSATTVAVGGDKVDTYAAAVATLETKEKAQADFAEAKAVWLATEELVDGFTALEDTNTDLDTAVTDATNAITNATTADPAGLGIDLFDGATATMNGGDDVYLYADDTAGTVNAFGQQGTDSVYFGEGYTLVALDSANDEVITDDVGDVATLEIFWEDTSAGLVLWVEETTFAGNASSATNDDLTKITLAGGVEGADVTFANGYLSAADLA